MPPSHDGVAGDVVAAAAYRHEQPVGAGEVHRGDDVGGAVAAHDQRRAAVDHAVPDHARRVVVVVGWLQQQHL